MFFCAEWSVNTNDFISSRFKEGRTICSYVPITNMGEFYLFTFELRCKHHDYKFLSLNSYTHLGL